MSESQDKPASGRRRPKNRSVENRRSKKHRDDNRHGTDRAGGNQQRRKPRGRSGENRPQRNLLEQVTNSGRNALKRHASSVRNEQNRLACRSLLIALHGAAQEVDNPGDLLGIIEQVHRVMHATRRDDTQLPVTLRAVVAFAVEVPARQRDVQEMLRLLLRYSYMQSADYIPRQARDDGRFRASALRDTFEQIAREYLDDENFERMQK